MRKTINDEKRLNDLIIDVQREPKHIKKRAFNDALKLLTRDTYEGTVKKLVYESVARLGARHVRRKVLAMPDSHVRNKLLVTWNYEWPGYQVFALGGSAASIMKTLLRSDFLAADQLRSAIIIEPALSNLAVKRALLLAAEEMPGTVSLLMRLAGTEQLKRKVRVRLSGAVLGLESATTHDLMKIVRDFPELREGAAAIVLTRPATLQPTDIALLLSYNNTKDMVEVMLQS